MKVSYQWLNEYLPLEKNQIEPSALAEKLALTSVDINEVYSPSDGLSNIVVGQIESVKERSFKLSVVHPMSARQPVRRLSLP